MTDTDAAWCAGFFDGEGHVSYRRGYPSKTSGRVSRMIHASIPQNSENIEVLEFFQSVIGFGKIKGPYPTKKGKSQHRLLYGKKEVLKLFVILKPYLKSEKSMDFTMALMGYDAHSFKPTSEDYARSNKRMMKKNT